MRIKHYQVGKPQPGVKGRKHDSITLKFVTHENLKFNANNEYDQGAELL